MHWGTSSLRQRSGAASNSSRVSHTARTMSLSWKDLDAYVGARATRGGLLPRGWQKVDGLDVG